MVPGRACGQGCCNGSWWTCVAPRPLLFLKGNLMCLEAGHLKPRCTWSGVKLAQDKFYKFPGQVLRISSVTNDSGVMILRRESHKWTPGESFQPVKFLAQISKELSIPRQVQLLMQGHLNEAEQERLSEQKSSVLLSSQPISGLPRPSSHPPLCQVLLRFFLENLFLLLCFL